MTGAQESLLHFEVHSFCLEQVPEHQPHFMKCGAVKHLEHVRKCAQPGPAEGTLNIFKRGTRPSSELDVKNNMRRTSSCRGNDRMYLISHYEEKRAI